MATGNHFWLDVRRRRRRRARRDGDHLPRRAALRAAASCTLGRTAARRPVRAVAGRRDQGAATRRGARRSRTRSMAGLARTRVTPNALTAAGVALCARRLGPRLLRVPQRVPLLLARRRRLRASARSSTSSTARSPAPAASRRRSARSSTRRPTGSARASCSARSRSSSHRDGNDVALAFAFAAVAGSFLVSYTRARAEALGLKGDVGIGSRAERVVVITAGLVLAPWGVLPWAIYLLAATAWITVGQRILSVRSASCRASTLHSAYAASTSVLAPSSQGRPRPDAGRAQAPPRATRSSAAAAASTTSPSASSPPGSPSRSSRAAGAGKPPRRGRVRAAPHAARAEGQARRAARRSASATLNDLIVETLSRAARKGTPWHPRTARRRAREDKVRVAIIGVGNCANSLLQGVEYYKDAPDDKFVPGLMHVNLGGYHVRDIEFVAAFDVRRTRSARTSPTRSGRTRTTRSSSPTSRRPASRSPAA